MRLLILVFAWLLTVTSGCENKSGKTERSEFTQTNPQLESRDQTITEEDLLILQRAKKILSDESVWDRQDDRNCDENDNSWSLFCALWKASIETLGEYKHRRVAMQEVRFAIEDVSDGMEFQHRLMDFNNLPSTTFSDIHKVLQIATERVESRLKKKSEQIVGGQLFEIS